MSSSQSYPADATFDDERNVLRVKWTIKNYRNVTSKLITSEKFSHSSAPPEWKLTIYPNHDPEKSVDHLSFFLYEEFYKFVSTAMVSFGYEDKSGTPFRELTLFKHASDGFGFSAFAKIEDVNAKLVKDDGSLTLLAEIYYASLRCDTRTQFSLIKLASDLGLELDGNYTDVVFQTRARSIKAHKLIIAYHSKYFKAIFDAESSGAHTVIIDITEFKFHVIRAFLEFIYKGILKFIAIKFASSLRIAAVKFEVPELAEICEDYIVANVDKKTAAKAILATSPVVSTRIRKACLEVFNKRTDYDDIDNLGKVYNDKDLCRYVVDGGRVIQQ